ncbi:MAG: hypothetical protein QOF74_1233 [Caballeronia mineralivorans]|jgi:hypothetical protein|nr:hypothetical protein [Caballeronia mineralivorans]
MAANLLSILRWALEFTDNLRDARYPLARNKSTNWSSVSDNKTVMFLTVWRNVEIAY